MDFYRSLLPPGLDRAQIHVVNRRVFAHTFAVATYLVFAPRVYSWNPADFAQSPKLPKLIFLCVSILINAAIGYKCGYWESFVFTGVFYFFNLFFLLFGGLSKLFYCVTMGFCIKYMSLLLYDWPKPICIFFVLLFYLWFGVLC